MDTTKVRPKTSLIEKKLQNKFYLPLIMTIYFIFWLIAYLSNNGFINSQIIYKLENIEFIIIGCSCLFLLIFMRNTFSIIPWIVFTPFVFARPFDAYTIPACIYIGLTLLVIGLIINYIVYRPKVIIGKYFWGILALGVAMITGGLFTKADYILNQTLLMLLCTIGFVCAYSIISSTSFSSFNEIARLMTYLGILLVLQLTTYFFIQDNSISAILSKGSDVGWGVSNNIGLMLLMTFPFTIYLMIDSKKIKCLFYMLIALLQICAIVFTYSRGSIIAMIFGIVILFVIKMIFARERMTILIGNMLIIILIGSIIYLIYTNKNEYFIQFQKYLLSVNFDSLNGRSPIYEEIFLKFKSRPIFGYGVFAGFSDALVSGTAGYQWGHSTITQTMYSMGSVGCLALIFHFFQKYFTLLKKTNLKKIIIAISFGISGLYGLFDISYYFINYMVVLVVLLGLIQKEVENISGVKSSC